jgi:hypothetical protein
MNPFIIIKAFNNDLLKSLVITWPLQWSKWQAKRHRGNHFYGLIDKQKDSAETTSMVSMTSKKTPRKPLLWCQWPAKKYRGNQFYGLNDKQKDIRGNHFYGLRDKQKDFAETFPKTVYSSIPL